MGGQKMINIFSIVLVLISTVFAAFGSLLLKKGSGSFSVKKLINFKLILGIIVYVLSTLFFIAALRFEDVSILYPISALSYIWVCLLSIKFLKEKVNKFKWAGIGLIIIGVGLLTF